MFYSYTTCERRAASVGVLLSVHLILDPLQHLLHPPQLLGDREESSLKQRSATTRKLHYSHIAALAHKSILETDRCVVSGSCDQAVLKGPRSLMCTHAILHKRATQLWEGRTQSFILERRWASSTSSSRLTANF